MADDAVKKLPTRRGRAPRLYSADGPELADSDQFVIVAMGTDPEPDDICALIFYFPWSSIPVFDSDEIYGPRRIDRLKAQTRVMGILLKSTVSFPRDALNCF